MPDHVHVLTSLPATVTIAQLAQASKGASSRWLNEQPDFEGHFQWQGRYGAFSVSPRDRSEIVAYIVNQEQHHAGGTTWQSVEEF
jgi:putative transposase